jgi:DNA-binding response OmpR family regulator/class 3 adenylate cyclase
VRDRIMIVGRDVGLRARLARLLKARGYSLEIADGPAHARRIGFAGVALAVVASDGLGPEWEGLMRELRATVGKVLFVAAPGKTLETDADLLDPTDEAGLLARVAQALAPAPEPEIVEPVLEFAGYSLDLGGHSLLDPQGDEIALTPGEFRLLQIFLRRPGRVLSRDQLLRILAGHDAESYDRSIDMQIVRLRRKIEADPKRPTLIVTVPGSGYKFAAKVRRAEPRAESQTTAAPREVLPVFAGRGYVTALSAELVPLGSDCLPDDPEDLCGVVEAYRHYATTVIGRHGGVTAERRAREVFAYFGYPVAREHAAETAVLAGLALVEPPEGEPPVPVGLAIRVALASGSVVTNPAGEVMGEAPGEAVRLLTIAEPGAVVADEGTRRLTGGLFEWADLGTVALKGAPHAVHAWRALGRSAVDSRFEALRAPQLSQMVGRNEELELLLRRWGQARTGSGRAVLISGEPGIGKSRLVMELEEALRPE